MPKAEPDISAIVARTSRSYDALPYTSNPIPKTHPALVGAIARLFALETAPLGTARVLELGCAAGGNIIPLAARHPGASIVGVDLSAAQVAAGRARIADLELANIEIRCQSFADFDSQNEGPFDYIICHGVYSWVPGPLRDAILRICRDGLAPRGVALVSYNVLPGWRMLQALRDCFLLHSTPDADPRRRAAQARALMQLLPRGAPDDGAYKSFLATEAARLADASDEYLAHEYLDDVNEPCTFRDFIDAAQRHGVAFLAEADLPSMIVSNYPPAMAEVVPRIGGNALLATEQSIDMVSGRTFRQTLLVAAERAARIDRQVAAARLDDLHFLGDAELALTREAGGATLARPSGRRLHTGSGPLAEALARFVAAFPGSASVDDLVQALPAAARNAEGRAMVREAALNMVINGLATPRTEPVRAAAQASARPIACPLARADAARGASATANLRHESVVLGEATRDALALLDGTRDTDAIARALPPGPAAATAMLSALARAGLLLA
jgi:2-polyprenyl-3-methyl-5-hydroxy-6-metoxy-1,4-benzoquinol methylase/methyltransferase-like protein